MTVVSRSRDSIGIKTRKRESPKNKQMCRRRRSRKENNNQKQKTIIHDGCY